MAAARSARVTADRVNVEGSYHWACFLAEQTAQLAVRALLHGVGSGATGHDLPAFGRRLGEALDTEISGTLDAALKRLSRHYIPPRYPDAHAADEPATHYGHDDTSEALRDADVIIDFVVSTWQELIELAEEE
ncbi:MAG: HEPN domain-containing protein [Actinobacteria bacterium]|nr:HEPN domain-containing protein [Actinomycetota bacterium]